ncbi:COX15/CtaA family protein [Pseudomonadota bacterium]|nr:COX15/CtaA family protein [Pseudomonadota bacterium]
MLASSKYIPSWLLVSAFMVFLMIIIGGITRLTGSGLSMVEWRPLFGFLPPMSDLEWTRVFELYKLSPEYILKNNGIELSEFKKIFFWEYFHRLWGRLIGIVFIIPFFIFLFYKQLPKQISNKIFIILALGSLQGVIGWWMVKSGLVNDPSVSQYRLAIHLSNALLILFLLVWTFLDTKEGYSSIKFNFSLFVFLILSTTIIAGAFVAGMDAGLMYNEYPFMGNGLVPENYGEYKILDPFENPASAQFHHRHLALLTMVSVLIYCFKSYKNNNDLKSKKIAIFLSCVVFFQFLLGIITLINMVPVHLGVLHQTGAVILFLGLAALMHRNNIDKKIN